MIKSTKNYVSVKNVSVFVKNFRPTSPMFLEISETAKKMIAAPEIAIDKFVQSADFTQDKSALFARMSESVASE